MSLSSRTAIVNQSPIRAERRYVLYWMIANRRPHWNFALDRAVAAALELGKPLVILEALRCDYPWASDRSHAFVLAGMEDNRRAFAGAPVTHRLYVEPRTGAGKGLLEALARDAALVVTDEFPCFFLPGMVRAAADRLDVRLEQVDANGLLPASAIDRPFERAVDFRRHLQRELPAFFDSFPAPRPFAAKGRDLPRLDCLPKELDARWPEPSTALLEATTAALAALPIDHSVSPVDVRGGCESARSRLAWFVSEGMPRYGEERNQPALDATSRLSPWLHFGHLSTHEVFAALAAKEGWNPSRVGHDARGGRSGWWGMSAAAEGFVDQLVTWRELGFAFCRRRPNYASFDSLPEWARATLDERAADVRPVLYELDDLERAATHDAVWNAAQRQLLREGRIHNYLRMLWGKKILEWSQTPRAAFVALEHLNNKYAVDGRDPNSYSGIAWCLGRFDRPWGPRRPIFGLVRYMSSENTARKFPLAAYLERYASIDGRGGGESPTQLLLA